MRDGRVRIGRTADTGNLLLRLRGGPSFLGHGLIAARGPAAQNVSRDLREDPAVVRRRRRDLVLAAGPETTSPDQISTAIIADVTGATTLAEPEQTTWSLGICRDHLLVLLCCVELVDGCDTADDDG